MGYWQFSINCYHKSGENWNKVDKTQISSVWYAEQIWYDLIFIQVWSKFYMGKKWKKNKEKIEITTWIDRDGQLLRKWNFYLARYNEKKWLLTDLPRNWCPKFEGVHTKLLSCTTNMQLGCTIHFKTGKKIK